MYITGFGFLWFGINIVAFFMGNNALLKLMLFSTMFQAAAVIIVGNYPINPLTITCMVYIVWYLIINKGKFIVTSQHLTFMCFLLYAFVQAIIAGFLFDGLTIYLGNGALESEVFHGNISIGEFVSLFVYAIVLILLYNKQSISRIEIERIIEFMTVILLVFGVWQYADYFGLIPRNNIVAQMLYSSRGVREEHIAYYAYLRNNRSILGTRFYSTFMEPSYCGGFLGVLFCYYISKKNHMIKDKLLIVSIVLMGILTFSATAYVGIAGGGFFSMLYLKNSDRLWKIVKRGIRIVTIGLIGIVVFNVWPVINEKILRKSTSHSAYIRGAWNKNCLNVCKETCGFGIGLGAVRGSSILPTALATVGVLGVLIYIAFLFNFIKRDTDDRNGGNNRYKALVATCIVALIISIPDFSYTILWFVLFIYMIDISIRYNVENKLSVV